MKKIFLLAAIATLAFTTSCDKEALNTTPTTAVSGDFMLENTEGGLMALNGTYRFFWQWGSTTTSNYHQSFGPQSYALMGDLMGEDMVQAASGNGWFWYDYTYNVKSKYTSGGWRSYDCWNYYYKLIANVNYIIAAEETMIGSEADVKYIMGNAYALRAYAYHYLAMTFARSYIGHEDRLCVPLFTEPTVAGTEGKPRSTNREVYAQAMADINHACELLSQGQAQKHITHIDRFVANGIKARIALTMGDYQTAYDAAKIAISGSKKLTKVVNAGYNNASATDVLWGAEIITAQGTTNPQFLTHMDIAFGGYGKASRKCCSAWLYNKISDTDARKVWWNYETLEDGKTKGYQQYKFLFADVSDPTTGADHIFMRVPEMYLTIAECALRLGRESEAQNVLNEFMTYRQPGYNCSSKTGTALGTLTTNETGSLLEEIILQRRIELWGEYGRIYDIKRLRQGFERTSSMGHPTAGLRQDLHFSDPETFDWVLTIPSAEIDANPLMVQNPLGSAAEGNYGDDPSLNPAQ